ncbi:MAG TPA: tetratricopeptide repeat protein, partial [Candidatus Binatia bacterium]|nr:tetratricopeptide repeat protein [Candidatus Binatia bacterium]
MIDIRKSRWALIFVLAAIGLFPRISGAAGIEEPLKAALELHESGQIKEAITEYDKVIKAHPKLAEAYFNRGNAYYDLGANPQAIKDYTEAIRLNPKDAEAYYNRGNAHRRL